MCLAVLIALMCSLDLGSMNLVFTLWVANVGYRGYNGFRYLCGFDRFGIGVLGGCRIAHGDKRSIFNILEVHCSICGWSLWLNNRNHPGIFLTHRSQNIYQYHPLWLLRPKLHSKIIKHDKVMSALQSTNIHKIKATWATCTKVTHQGQQSVSWLGHTARLPMMTGPSRLTIPMQPTYTR